MKRHASLMAMATVAMAMRLWSPNPVEAGEWSQTLDRLPAEFTIENPGPALERFKHASSYIQRL